jgi:hypothetical protein
MYPTTAIVASITADREREAHAARQARAARRSRAAEAARTAPLRLALITLRVSR